MDQVEHRGASLQMLQKPHRARRALPARNR
jgi:hypothetical protein